MKLEGLDDWQGSDPEILELREKMHEPTRSPYPTDRMYVMVPPKCPSWSFWREQEIIPSMDSGIERLEFQRIQIEGDGVSFFAWKCLKDGKCYF